MAWDDILKALVKHATTIPDFARPGVQAAEGAAGDILSALGNVYGQSALDPAAVNKTFAMMTPNLPGGGGNLELEGGVNAGKKKPAPPAAPAAPAPGSQPISLEDLSSLLSADQTSALNKLNAMIGGGSPKMRPDLPKGFADTFAKGAQAENQAYQNLSQANAAAVPVQALAAMLRATQLPKSTLLADATSASPTSVLAQVTGSTKGL